MPNPQPDAALMADRGLHACRRGAWRQGIRLLVSAIESDNGAGRVPSVAFSYLGYGLAACEGRTREGLNLCQHAVEQEFFRGENYLNLARVHLLIGNRAHAVRTIGQGLEVEPENKELLDLQRSMGHRRLPPLGFLPRSHTVNRFLGRLRHLLLG